MPTLPSAKKPKSNRLTIASAGMLALRGGFKDDCGCVHGRERRRISNWLEESHLLDDRRPVNNISVHDRLTLQTGLKACNRFASLE